jgi:hypothetical protein
MKVLSKVDRLDQLAGSPDAIEKIGVKDNAGAEACGGDRIHADLRRRRGDGQIQMRSGCLEQFQKVSNGRSAKTSVAAVELPNAAIRIKRAGPPR